MNTHTISYLFAIAFIAAGLIGFIDNPLVSETGLFAVNTTHNLVHILTGAVFVVGMSKYRGRESLVFKLVGLAYTAVAVLGFLTSGDMLLAVVRLNEADRWLHLGLAIVILGSGFLFRDDTANTVVRSTP